MNKKVKVAVAVALSAAISLSALSASAYINGAKVEDEWATSTLEYGVGDPYVMKYDGMYYLYCSTLDNNIGVKVWSSENMVEWNYEGLCSSTTDEVMKGAYAPEVTYWNGTFYMYSASPGGEQHRVLTSKSPLGPFERQGDVFTESDDLIDGSVFIDDNAAASKYFLHSGGSCIEYGILNNNMLTASGKNQLSAATVIGHWTEGPSVFKRGGKYYMTYCGNHVQADNYMVEYVAGDSFTSMKEPEENLILINTEEGITGLGHNSTVIGPDLDSRYIVYHNLVSNTNAPERRLNIDRIVFNGEKLEVQGPTWWEVDNPKMPEFYDRMTNADNWDNITDSVVVEDKKLVLADTNELLSKTAASDDYTAEFNFTINSHSENAKAGAIVSYSDGRNYAYAYITPENNKLNLDIVSDGVVVSKSAALPAEYTYTGDELRKITVKKEGGVMDVYSDDRLLITAETSLSGGKIGLKTDNCSAGYSYTAFSSTVNGNEDKNTVKPTGSAMDAVHSNTTSREFETGTITESGAGLKSGYFKGLTTGDSLTFNINAGALAYYSAEILAKAGENTTVSLSLDGKLIADKISLTQSDNFFTDVVRNLVIDEKSNELTLSVDSGTLDLYSVKLDKSGDIFNVTELQKDINFEWLDGSWNESADTISTTDAATWSTASYGNEGWGDYTYEADVSITSGSDVGLMLRLNYATDSSDANNGIGGCNSADYHYGYYAFISKNGVFLGKQMFNWKQLSGVSTPLSENRTYHLKAQADGANIKVWLDGELKIDYTDTDRPIMSGKVGLRAYKSNSSYQNITLTHLNTAQPLSEPVKLKSGAVDINKNTFDLYSNAKGKGFEIKDSGINFNNGQKRSIKGCLKQTVPLDSTVSCDITLPGTGGFGTGLLVRCMPSAFGEGTDALDGIGVQLERAADSSANIKVYSWENGAWKGTLATQNIPEFFTNQQERTVRLAVNTSGESFTVYVDGTKYLSLSIDGYSDESRTAVGFRSHNSAHVTLGNYSVSTLSGDVNFDGMVTVSDVVTLRKTIMSGTANDELLAMGDLDADGNLTVSDVVTLRKNIMAG